MERKKNKFKDMIARGEVVLGTCICGFSPALIELAGFCGLDFCRIDNEHTWRQDYTTEDLLRGAFCADIVPLLRIDKDNPYLVRKALEAGAGGVIVPHINTRREVEEIVESAKFPPLWGRGVTAPFASQASGVLVPEQSGWIGAIKRLWSFP